MGQGSGKLSLRASMEMQMVTFCSYVEYARPIRKNKKEPIQKLREILAKPRYKPTI